MATYTVNVSYFSGSANFNFSQITGGAGANASNPIDLQEGDVLQFSCVKAPTDPAMTIKTFSSAYWTSTADILFTSSGSNSRTVKTNPTLSASSVGVYTGGSLDDVCYFNVISSVDTLPDSIDGDMGANITNANPSQVYEFDPVTVSGVNTSVTSSVSGASAQQRKSLNGTWVTSDLSVSDGDKVYVRGTAASTYSTGATVTLKIGGNTAGTLNTDYVQDQITMTTGVDPNTGTKIPFPITSGTISLGDIIDFFGGRSYSAASYTRPTDIASYYRNGSYVPNLTTGTPNNSTIPTSGTIEFDDFYSSCTTFYFSVPPNNRFDYVDTSGNNGSGTADVAKVVWSLQTGAGYFNGATQTNNWAMGYGPGMTYNAEYKWEHTAGSQFGSNVTFTSPFTSTALGVFSQNNTFLEVSISTQHFTEAQYSGTITLTARHPDYTSYTVQTTFTYTIGFFGP
jgi:hypothetical protein